jgi:ribonuclease Y
MLKDILKKLMQKELPQEAEVKEVGSADIEIKKEEQPGESEKKVEEKREEDKQVTSDNLEAKLSEVRAKAKEIVLEAKDQALKIKSQAEEEAQRIKQAALEEERKLNVEKAELNSRAKELEERSKTLKKAKEAIDKMEDEARALINKRKEELEKVSSLTKQEAREQMLEQVDKELAEEKTKKIKQMNEEIKKNVEKEAQQLLVEAMRFGATDYIVEYTSSKVKLPDEDIKGRIIGKEGRNIRTLEELTGVEFDLDSSPGEVLLSCFDPIRREIAKTALERLIKDGRIQPARIEEIVNKTKEELDHIIQKAGDDLCHRVGAYDVPKELVYMLGKFKYRFSYGQNMIEHTLEETKMGVALAHELGVDVDTVRLGCLFHDIGKIVTEDEGSHIELGVDLLNKYDIPEEVVNCVAEHHEDKPFSSIESAVVNLVDHVSGARPGARGEDYESYMKRMKALEDAARSFDGVDRVYAISAGREVRVFVEPDKVDDSSAEFLAREIAKKIELEQKYPGVVNVTVIRETRVTETAK